VGMRGPVPKLTSQRLGHLTRSDRERASSLAVSGVVTAPERPLEGLHPVAALWYDSLKQSGQSALFEPSDWAAAAFLAEALTRTLDAERLNPQLLTAVWNAMEDLLTTESSRRRVHVEVRRDRGEARAEHSLTALEEYKQRLGG